MQEFMMTLLQSVLTAAVPVVATFLCRLLLAKKQEATARMQSESAKRLLEEACDAVTNAVLCTNQTYVDALKESGTFSPENQKEAFRRAYEAALSIMSEEAAAFVGNLCGDLDAWLKTMIEARVAASDALRLKQ